MSSIRIVSALLLFNSLTLLPGKGDAAQHRPKPTISTYTNNVCGFEFTRVKNWKVTVEHQPRSSRRCELIVTFSRRAVGKPTEKHSVLLTMEDKDYQSAIDDNGFEKQDSQWLATPPEEIHGTTWVGLKAITSVRCYGEQGYEGMGEGIVALLNDKARKSAFVDAGECQNFDEAGLELFLKFFEFLH